jgi:hypothetical protein
MNQAETKLWEIKTMYEQERADLNAKLIEEKEHSQSCLFHKENEFHKIIENERRKSQQEFEKSGKQLKFELNTERSKFENLKIKSNQRISNCDAEKFKKSTRELIDLLKQKDEDIWVLRTELNRMDQGMALLQKSFPLDQRSVSDKTEALLHDDCDVELEEFGANLENPMHNHSVLKSGQMSPYKILSNVDGKKRNVAENYRNEKGKYTKLVNFAEDNPRVRSQSDNFNVVGSQKSAKKGSS